MNSAGRGPAGPGWTLCPGNDQRAFEPVSDRSDDPRAGRSPSWGTPQPDVQLASLGVEELGEVVIDFVQVEVCGVEGFFSAGSLRGSLGPFVQPPDVFAV